MASELASIYSYDNKFYDFRRLVERILSARPLEQLHKRMSGPLPGFETDDQDSDLHRAFYAGFDELTSLYESFLREYVTPIAGAKLVVQRVPTFRIHPPGGIAVSEFHRDSQYNHPIGIINFWVPLTPCFGTNSMWLETDIDSESYRAVEMEVGQFLRFDAIRLRHGNHINDTAQTRVSFDFRVISASQFTAEGHASVSSKLSLDLGAYYALLTPTGIQ